MELLDTALGASSQQDGVSLIHGTLGVGQFRPGPIEIHETEFPMRVVRFDVRTRFRRAGQVSRRTWLHAGVSIIGRRRRARARQRRHAQQISALGRTRRQARAHGILRGQWRGASGNRT